MAFIDGTLVNVAVPTLQTTFHASVVDVQWVVEFQGFIFDFGQELRRKVLNGENRVLWRT